MQAYMHDQIVRLAQRPTKEEAVEQIEAVLGRVDGPEPMGTAILADLTAERR